MLRGEKNLFFVSLLSVSLTCENLISFSDRNNNAKDFAFGEAKSFFADERLRDVLNSGKLYFAGKVGFVCL